MPPGMVLLRAVSLLSFFGAFFSINANSALVAPAARAHPSKISRVSDMVSSMETLAAKQAKHSKLADDVLLPFVAEMKPLLQRARGGKEQSDSDKKLADALMSKLALAMANRGQELLAEQRDEKVSLLMGVLLEKAKDGVSLENQYTVLEDKGFRSLDVARAVLARRGKDGRDLVEQCGTSRSIVLVYPLVYSAQQELQE